MCPYRYFFISLVEAAEGIEPTYSGLQDQHSSLRASQPLLESQEGFEPSLWWLKRPLQGQTLLLTHGAGRKNWTPSNRFEACCAIHYTIPAWCRRKDLNPYFLRFFFLILYPLRGYITIIRSEVCFLYTTSAWRVRWDSNPYSSS